MFHNFNIWLFDIYFREKVGGWEHRKFILKRDKEREERKERGEDTDYDEGRERRSAVVFLCVIFFCFGIRYTFDEFLVNSRTIF